MHSTRGTILSMLDGSTTNFLGSAAQTQCAWHPQLVSKKILKKEIFAGTNFRELEFDRVYCEKFCLAKISRCTVYSTYIPGSCCLGLAVSDRKVRRMGP